MTSSLSLLMMFSYLLKTKRIEWSSFKDIGFSDFAITILTDPKEMLPLTKPRINVARVNAFF